MAMENHQFQFTNPPEIAIFHSYVDITTGQSSMKLASSWNFSRCTHCRAHVLDGGALRTDSLLCRSGDESKMAQIIGVPKSPDPCRDLLPLILNYVDVHDAYIYHSVLVCIIYTYVICHMSYIIHVLYIYT